MALFHTSEPWRFAIAEYDFIVLLLLLSWTLCFIAVDEFDSVAQ
jgi:hypothetical protein